MSTLQTLLDTYRSETATERDKGTASEKLQMEHWTQLSLLSLFGMFTENTCSTGLGG